MVKRSGANSKSNWWQPKASNAPLRWSRRLCSLQWHGARRVSGLHLCVHGRDWRISPKCAGRSMGRAKSARTRHHAAMQESPTRAGLLDFLPWPPTQYSGRGLITNGPDLHPTRSVT